MEAGFLDWIVDVAGGERFIERLAAAHALAWEDVEHDVVEVLDDSLVVPGLGTCSVGTTRRAGWPRT